MLIACYINTQCMFIRISGEIRKQLVAMLASTEGKAESLAFPCLPIGSVCAFTQIN